jgi:hypothetical protein
MRLHEHHPLVTSRIVRLICNNLCLQFEEFLLVGKMRFLETLTVGMIALSNRRLVPENETHAARMSEGLFQQLRELSVGTMRMDAAGYIACAPRLRHLACDLGAYRAFRWRMESRELETLACGDTFPISIEAETNETNETTSDPASNVAKQSSDVVRQLSGFEKLCRLFRHYPGLRALSLQSLEFLFPKRSIPLSGTNPTRRTPRYVRGATSSLPPPPPPPLSRLLTHLEIHGARWVCSEDELDPVLTQHRIASFAAWFPATQVLVIRGGCEYDIDEIVEFDRFENLRHLDLGAMDIVGSVLSQLLTRLPASLRRVTVSRCVDQSLVTQLAARGVELTGPTCYFTTSEIEHGYFHHIQPDVEPDHFRLVDGDHLVLRPGPVPPSMNRLPSQSARVAQNPCAGSCPCAMLDDYRSMYRSNPRNTTSTDAYPSDAMDLTRCATNRAVMECLYARCLGRLMGNYEFIREATRMFSGHSSCSEGLARFVHNQLFRQCISLDAKVDVTHGSADRDSRGKSVRQKWEHSLRHAYFWRLPEPLLSYLFESIEKCVRHVVPAETIRFLKPPSATVN